MNRVRVVDFAVIGTGLAGSAAAHLLGESGDVALISKGLPAASNSHAAQGGMAAAVGPGDHPDLHFSDTLAAGDGFCDPAAVRGLVRRAPEAVAWLATLGVKFDRDAWGNTAYGLEGAHSRPRVLHIGGDATGAHLLAALTDAIEKSPRIERIVGGAVRALLRCGKAVCGALVEDAAGRRLFVLAQRATILATGGIGQIFSRTTNPPGATGDGIALAYEADAIVRNLEFVQFHPTALGGEGNPRFLISEAVRGAGAQLVDCSGAPLLADHPQGSLAPRDVVARRIAAAEEGGGAVFLDARGVDGFAERFPTIDAACRATGVDARTALIPVSPAAHFAMGGVAARLTGETSVPGLYAIGEVASTGVHGANRLASNSLLECLVMARELARHMATRTARFGLGEVDLDASAQEGFASTDQAVMGELREVMWRSAGIVRDGPRLKEGLRRVAELERQVPGMAPLLTARLILESALWREESRGAHFRADFPDRSERFAGQDTVADKLARLAMEDR